MQSKIIKSKQAAEDILEIVEFSDISGNIVNYLVIKAHKGQNYYGSGAAKIEEVSFLNKEEAMAFFNNQN